MVLAKGPAAGRLCADVGQVSNLPHVAAYGPTPSNRAIALLMIASEAGVTRVAVGS
jgi:hypothetical protein